MNRQVAEASSWGEEQILFRNTQLVEEISKIWDHPIITKKTKPEIDTRTEFDLMDDVEATRRSPVEVEICGEVHTVDS